MLYTKEEIEPISTLYFYKVSFTPSNALLFRFFQMTYMIAKVTTLHIHGQLCLTFFVVPDIGKKIVMVKLSKVQIVIVLVLNGNCNIGKIAILYQ